MKIYTDGACSTNGTWDGGAAIVVLNNNNEEVCTEYTNSKNTTNNQMELTAVIMALQYIYNNSKEKEENIIYTDSAYIYNCINQKWYKKWRENGWITSKKTFVENRGLWEELLTFYEKCDIIKIEKVKGHNGDKYNEKVDELAVYARNLISKEGL